MKTSAMQFRYLLLISIFFLSSYAGSCNNGNPASPVSADFKADSSDITLVAGGPGAAMKFTLQADEKQLVQIGQDTSASGNPGGLVMHYGNCVGTSCLRYRNNYVIDTLFAHVSTVPGTYICRMNLFYIDNTPLVGTIHKIDDVTLRVHVLPHATTPVIFSDSFFLMQDWNDTVLFSTRQTKTFGDHVDIRGNPGAYGETVVEFDSGSGQTPVVAELFQRATYDPAASGDVSSLDFAWDSYDSVQYHTNIDTAAGIAPIVIQRGTVFIEKWHYGALIQWFHGESKTLSASGFTDFPASSGKHPDFSVTAAPIRFGYAIKTPVQSGNAYNVFTLGVDNFVVTVHR
jgi:hypothetical protein